jgi:hypothetical protein
MPFAVTALTALCGQAVAQGAFPAPLPGQSGNAASPFPDPKRASPFPDPRGAGGTTRSTAPAPSAASASPFPAVNGASASNASQQSNNAAASPNVFNRGAAPLGGLGGGGGLAAAPPPGTADQEECMAKFTPLKQDAEKRAMAIKGASERKASPQEACALIRSYVQAEAKLVNFVTAKQTACGIPSDIPKGLKANQARSQQMMKQVCQAAAQPQGGPSAAPSLSEVLGSPSAPSEVRTVRSGGSTFDTINGNVLSR